MNKNSAFMSNKNIAIPRSLMVFFIVGFVLVSASLHEPMNNDNKIDLIMIDAGHGGTDPGNLGTKRYSTTEKDITLKVAVKLGKYIQDKIPGVKVIYSRTNDTYPTLKERTEKANKENVDLFISIHCDSFHKESALGCGSYVMGTAKTDANLKMAQRENASMLKEKDYEKIYGGFDPYSPESYIELSLRQNAFIDQSLNFSDKVQSQFRDRVGRVDRGVKQAPFWVISYTTMPSVLIELGFLTNKKEEDFLITEKGQDLMASAIFRAFRGYREEFNSLQNAEEEKVRSEDISEVQIEETIKEQIVEKPSTITATGLVYKVQLLTSSIKIALNPANFHGLNGVDEYISNGFYKYTIGNEKHYNSAKKLQKQAQERGFDGAFVLAFENGERISLQQALLGE